jgi:glycosyltransferase involved in cell wall biosynthesis
MMSGIDDEMLVSFVICTYNQQDTIGAAVKSALSQTYSPLEIIISDDASSDRTVQIIRGAISAYSGPHKIILNENEVNLGVAKHWDSISRLANGRLIIHAAGDDISMPHRASAIVGVWVTMNPRPVLISSNGMMMSYEGRDLWPLENTDLGGAPITQTGVVNNDFDLLEIPVIGFSLAIDSILYKKFPPLSFWMWSEDEIMRTRAMLIGTMVYLPDVLVKYRDGGISNTTSLTKAEYAKKFRDQANSRLNYIIQMAIDLNYLNGGLFGFEKKYLKKLDMAIKQVRLSTGGNIFYDLYLLAIFLTNREIVLKVTRGECITMFGVNHMHSIFFKLKQTKYLLWKLAKR